MTVLNRNKNGCDSLLDSKGYTNFRAENCHIVSLKWAVDVISAALMHGTLYEWAIRQPDRVEMVGRGSIYSVKLPTVPAVDVVVRRNRHGGLLRFLTGDLFLRPTRAQYELETSMRLSAAGVLTTEIIAYAVYPVARFFARCDVMTRLLPTGGDLPALWITFDDERREASLVAIAELLCRLDAAGGWHADLNLKNIYIAVEASGLTAYLLDVDRVTFPPAGDVAELNWQRLSRSVRKWRNRWGLDFSEEMLMKLAALKKGGI